LKKILVCFLLVFSAFLSFAPYSFAIEGSLPYNFRTIDKNVCAGGHPLGPNTDFGNSDEKVLSILSALKSRGINTVIDLENTGYIQVRYQKLLDKAGLKRLHIPMNAVKVPDAKEWKLIKEAMEKPVYVHCKWGADRTGAVIGRYLVEEKHYTPEDAYEAVITGGKFAGPLGGLKTGIAFDMLKKFIF
jgi:protein-tyrosine phosphatase